MTQLTANGITLDYAETGSPDAPVLVLIRGLGTQRIQWPAAFVDGLAKRGLRVVAHDNRDVGLSEKFSAFGTPDVGATMAAIAKGETASLAYDVADMAKDVIGLLDSLGIARAHVLGISMGGMIVQHLAASHGGRLLSMTSVMSSSGAAGLPPATPAAMAALMSRPKDPNSRDSVIENNVASQKVFGSPGYPTSDADLQAMAGRAYDRCHCPDGVARQMLAVMADRTRSELLAEVDVPSLVIHGEDDPLIPIECGRDTAERIPGARFQAIAGMGHDVPAGLVDTLIELVADHIKRAR
jgi:pimeloyl-ACP methyl ester carboxylesterase